MIQIRRIREENTWKNNKKNMIFDTPSEKKS